MAQPPFILLVEDDQQLRKIIARNLNVIGYSVLEADGYSKAVDQLAIKPDLVILDINLPDASGWDVARWIEAAMSPIPIIVTSGIRASQRDMKHFEPKAFLSKPFDIRQLLALILQPQLVW